MSIERAVYPVKIKRVENGEALRGGEMEGWTDMDVPEPGWPFRVWGPPRDDPRAQFRLLQTSPVKGFTPVPRIDDAKVYLIKTMNSIYEVQYGKQPKGRNQADGELLGAWFTKWAVSSECS